MISVEAVRESLRKDDQPYINNLITQNIATAQAALLISVGGKKAFVGYDTAPSGYEEEYDSLVAQYIVEYCRGAIDHVDNERTLTILAIQIEALLHKH